MKKHGVLCQFCVWSVLTLAGLPVAVFAQGLGGTSPAAPSGKMPMTPPATSAPRSPPRLLPYGVCIHGNKKSRVYHLANCPGYTKVSATNLTSFATEDEAVRAGFHKAKNCPK